MKIISGIYKARNILGYDIDGTRPTMDRVRESLFAMIQDYLDDKIVLDLFAGTGSLGLEALSNKAKYCYFNDSNIKCTNIIKQNIKNFNNSDKCTVLNFDYKKALKYLKEKGIKFDIIFLDPPYKMKINKEIIDYIIESEIINKGGIVVCEMEANYIEDINMKLLKSRHYKEKEIMIFIFE